MSDDVLTRMIRAHGERETWLAEDESTYLFGIQRLEGQVRERRHFTRRSILALVAMTPDGLGEDK